MLRMADLKRGQVYLVLNPVRVAKVVGPTEAKLYDPVRRVSLPGPAVNMLIGMPTFEVPGHIGPKQAKANREIAQAVVASCASFENDDSEWKEIWAERLVGKVVKTREGYTRVSDIADTPQLFCHHHEGRLRQRAKQYMTGNGQIEAVLLDPKQVPKGYWKSERVKETANARAE